MASQLSLYNDALLLCGQRALSSLSETNEGRRLLDQVWNNQGVDACLAEGLWHFALRTVQIDYDTDEDPAFGWTYAFTRPTDWLRTAAVCADEYYRSPLTEYTLENGFWYADIQPIYVRYVSNGSGYGGNIGDWPVEFKEYVAAAFARKIVRKVSGDADRVREVDFFYREAKSNALNNAAMAQAPTFYPTGNWVRSRGNASRREGGNSNGPLIG